ncbi:hypothetical protein COT44_04005 [Candidatus Shapirobacteria bacterium CG08_land_8_20_14_0_20_39_18]|uniref:Uncharacterized protein n=1 Tax=Candidatus Shapirobacteria bacterium CG08_land_8_20_14_0_20_39_18 TaxID=1974883 RepID=A0A2M6XCK0_9BACT|nr:MAG: hypothetical protein COT44_04005 [Candidatus Shapirobacteria bacterium CG08_land_8_20_14_0_20_39_18]PIY65550.1 MAG: hypothetical protein COY91_02050 [Candidatus Shapirobacteria bacterium CG_4_10_14_0_8_um_filter_39_15]
MRIKKKGKYYMTKRKSRIPKFKTIEEEAKFWDTHSLSDYWDEFKDVDIVFDLQKPKQETLILRLQKEVKNKLEKVAKSKGLSVSSLARIWLMEKLQTSKA